MNIHVINENGLNVPRGLYTSWMGNALPDATASVLLASGSALLTSIDKPGDSTSEIQIPQGTPQSNTAMLQGLLSVGGKISVLNDTPILINDTLIVKSGTHIKGLKVRLAPNTNKSMMRNASWDGAAKTITALTNASVSIGGSLAVVATATVTAHGKSVGDTVFITGVTPVSYNGMWKIRTVPDANTLTFVMSYDVGDVIAAGSGVQYPHIQTVNTWSVNSLNTTSGVTAVTGTGFVAGAEWVGKSLTSVVAGVFTVLGTIQSVASSTAMTLAAGATATVTAGKWSIYNPAVMSMYDADDSITLEDCEFDYDFANQTTPDTHLKHGVYLRRVNNLSIIRTRPNATKYAIAVANCYDVTMDGVDFDTVSDGVHFLGSGGNITVRGVAGKTGDDCVAFGQSDYYQYLDPNHAFGDFTNVLLENVNPKLGFTAIKYYGCGNTKITDLTIANSGGSISGGNGNILVITDPNCVGCEAGAGGGVTKANKVTIDAVIDQNSSKPAIFVSAATIDEFITPRLLVGLGNTVGTSCGVLIANGTKIDNWSGGDIRFYSSSGAFANNAAGIRVDGTSLVSRYNLANASAKNISWFLLHNAVGHAEDAVSFCVGTITGDSLDYAVLSAGRINVRIGMAIKRGVVNSNTWFFFNDFSKIDVASATGLDGAPSIAIATGKNVQINAPDVGFDTTNTGGAAPGGIVVGQRKSSFFHMSATTLGTLERFNPVYWDPTRLKWVQLTNTTLTS